MNINVLQYFLICYLFTLGFSEGKDPFVHSINEFSLSLFNQVCKMKSDENVVLSPFSLSMALAMLHQGTSGGTEKEIASTVFTGLSKENVAKKFKQLREVDLSGLLRENPNVTVSVANKVYVRKDSVIKKSFRDSLSSNFEAMAEAIDFDDKTGAAAKINSWVSEATKQKIDNLMQPSAIPDETSLLVLNAIYLKGLWHHTFKEQFTRKDKFLTKGKNAEDVDMMHASFSIHRSNGDKISEDFPVQSFMLDYLGKRMSMLVLLPQENVQLEKIIEKLNSSEILQKIVSETTKSSGQVSLSMPKFKTSQEYHLLGTLKDLGIKNWSDLGETLESGSDKLQVSGIMQKAVIEVNEKSTEAAAVSAITISNRSLVLRKEIEVNRPFIYLIIDNVTELVLFIGKVVDPSTT